MEIEADKILKKQSSGGNPVLIEVKIWYSEGTLSSKSSAFVLCYILTG